MDVIDVIERLNQLRLERNMSVYRLAELSGINQSTLANTFSRGTLPSLMHLDLICQTLGVSLSQFFADDESPMQLTPDEIALITNYRKLPHAIKQSVADIVLQIPTLRN
ncbi:MAG: helix-turn-helix transcriptional regulator [Clostridiales bacterium]|nr:helix-turn-helix transcriptional regulator [Clostridiales bacterium]